MNRITVLLADDQMLFVESLKMVIGARARDIEVVGIARNGKEAIALVEQRPPDVLLMDVRMPVLDGVEAARHIHESHPQVRIIMLTTFDDDEYVHNALHHGAVGYLLKDILPSELISAIRAAKDGAAMISPAIITKLVEHKSGRAPQQSSPPPPDTGREKSHPLDRLSRREVAVYELLLEGYDNKQIAERLCIGEQTVRNHVSTIYSKMGVHSRVQLIRRRH